MSGGGFTAGLKTVADPLSPSVEFLASQDYTVKRSGITLDATAVAADGAGNKIVKGGTVLYRHAATGKYAPAPAGGATGTDAEAKGLLFAGDVNLRDGDVVCGMLIRGSVYEARCTGVTSAVKTALGDKILWQ
ncbi:hypothetical protein ACFXGA_06150 [Actinosynnema sp. NPDC059335]|uniref:hypothetical protein n=1 Tax=Actinosynnema sp. NPDC059335 TaxID=3346804 RepID=UPI0036729502